MRYRLSIPLLLTPLLTLVAAGCGHHKTQRAARVSERPDAPVTVHRSLDKAVRVIDTSSKTLPDGRLSIRVRISGEAKQGIAVVAQTNWFDHAGAIIEQGPTRVVVLDRGSIVAYEDASFSAQARYYTVALRPSRDEE